MNARVPMSPREYATLQASWSLREGVSEALLHLPHQPERAQALLVVAQRSSEAAMDEATKR